MKVCKKISAPCDTIGSTATRASPSEFRLYRSTKPDGLRFEARIGALRTPVSEVIAARSTDQSRARADERGERLEGYRAPRPAPAPRASSKTRTLRLTAAKVARD